MSDRITQLVLARLMHRARRRAIGRAIEAGLLEEDDGADDGADQGGGHRLNLTPSPWDIDSDEGDTARRGRLVPGWQLQDRPFAAVMRILTRHGIHLDGGHLDGGHLHGGQLHGVLLPGASAEDRPAKPDVTGRGPALSDRDFVRAVWRSTAWLRADEVAVMLLLRDALAHAGCDDAAIRTLFDLSGAMITLVSPIDGFEHCLADLIKQDAFASDSNTINGYDLRGDKIASRRVRHSGRTIVLFRNDRGSERDAVEVDEKVASAIRFGAPILGLASSVDGLPSRLMRCADLALETAVLSPALIGEVITRVIGQAPSPGELTSLHYVCARLAMRDLATAIRPGHTPARIIDLLRRLGEDAADGSGHPGRMHGAAGALRSGAATGKASKLVEKDRSGKVIHSGSDIVQPVAAKTLADDPQVTTIERLHGYGAARTWALDLADDLDQWRQGKVGWSDLSTKLLLSGPPGTGKTTFARALCNTLQLPLIATSVSTWLEPSHLGDVIRRMRVAFDEAQGLGPAILFIDEIDGIGQRGQGHEHDDYWNAVVNKALELLDGAIRSEGLIIVGATNHPSVIDPALRRSGRLETHIEIPLPDVDALVGILAQHLGKDCLAVIDSRPEVSSAEGSMADTAGSETLQEDVPTAEHLGGGAVQADGSQRETAGADTDDDEEHIAPPITPVPDRASREVSR